MEKQTRRKILINKKFQFGIMLMSLFHVISAVLIMGSALFIPLAVQLYDKRLDIPEAALAAEKILYLVLVLSSEKKQDEHTHRKEGVANKLEKCLQVALIHHHGRTVPAGVQEVRPVRGEYTRTQPQKSTRRSVKCILINLRAYSFA